MNDTLKEECDEEMISFTITCKRCKSTNCRTYRKFYPEMKGECKIVCLNCGNDEFV